MTSFGADTGTRGHGTMIGTRMVHGMRTETRFGTATGSHGVQTGIL